MNIYTLPFSSKTIWVEQNCAAWVGGKVWLDKYSHATTALCHLKKGSSGHLGTFLSTNTWTLTQFQGKKWTFNTLMPPACLKVGGNARSTKNAQHVQLCPQVSPGLIKRGVPNQGDNIPGLSSRCKETIWPFYYGTKDTYVCMCWDTHNSTKELFSR